MTEPRPRQHLDFWCKIVGGRLIVPEHIWKDVPGRDGIASPADWPNPEPVGYGGFRFREWRKRGRPDLVQFWSETR